MAILYKVTEWQSETGKWFVTNPQAVGTLGNQWWIPTAILHITPVDFVMLLKNKFNATNFHYNLDNNVLIFSFNSQTEARQYKNWINAQARKVNFLI